MARLQKADFGGTRYQGSAQSRNFTSVKAASSQKALQGYKEQVAADDAVKNRELERQFQLENLERSGQQDADSQALKIQLEAEGFALQRQQLWNEGTLNNKQLNEKNKQKVEQTLQTNVLKLDTLASEQQDQFNQTAQQLSSQVQNARTQAFSTAINGMLSFAGSVVKYNADIKQLKKVDQERLDSIKFFKGASLDVAEKLITADDNQTTVELAGEQAIQNTTSSPIERSVLRQGQVLARSERVMNQMSTRDFGTSYYGKIAGWQQSGAQIPNPNGVGTIDSRNPKTFAEADAIVKYGMNQLFRSVDVQGMDGAEAVRSLRAQVDNANLQLSTKLYGQVEKNTLETANFTAKANFYSEYASNKYPLEVSFQRLAKANQINGGMSQAAASKSAYETMRDFFKGTDNEQGLIALGNIEQVPGNAGTKLAYMYGEELENAIVDTYSDIEGQRTRIAQQGRRQMLESLRGITDPAQRISIIDAQIKSFERAGLDDAAIKLAGELDIYKSDSGAKIGDALITGQIDSGEISTIEQLEEKRELGGLTDKGFEAAKKRLGQRSLGLPPKNGQVKVALKSAQTSANLKLEQALGFTKDAQGNLVIDPGFGKRTLGVTKSQVEEVQNAINFQLTYAMNEVVAQNPDLLKPGNEQALNAKLAQVSKEWQNDNMMSPGGLFRVDDLLAKADQVGEDKNFTPQQQWRFKNLANSPTLMNQLSGNWLTSQSPLDIAPLDISKGGTVALTRETVRDYNGLRGDLLFTPDQVASMHEAWGNGIVDPDLQKAAQLVGKTPLALLNQQATSPIAPRGLKTYIPTQASVSPLSNSTAPISAVEGAQLLMSIGFPSKGAAYLAGNIQQESSWDGQQEPWDDVGAEAGGLPSWRGERLAKIEAILGKDVEKASNIEQVRAMKLELQRDYNQMDPRYGVNPNQVFNNPYATDRQLIAASKAYWGYGEQGSRYGIANGVYKMISNPMSRTPAANIVRGKQGYIGTNNVIDLKYPLENGQTVKLAPQAGNAFQKMVKAGMPLEGITNVYRDESEYLRLVSEGYGAVPNSSHNHGCGIDAHGAAGAWMKANGARYGWVLVDYEGSHGGHFEYKP